MRTDPYETNLVIIDGTAQTRMDSLVATLDALGWPWRAARIMRLPSRRFRDWLYERVAASRYGLFGKKKAARFRLAT